MGVRTAETMTTSRDMEGMFSGFSKKAAKGSMA